MATGRRMHGGTALARAIQSDGRPGYQIAAAAGLAPWQLYDYAAAKRKIPTRHLNRLCAVLGRDPEDLLGP